MWRRRTGADLLDTEEMAAFFARLDHLNQEQLLRMSAAWKALSPAEHQGAWAAVRAVGVAEGLTTAIDRVRDKALSWSRRGSNRPLYGNRGDRDWLEVKMDAGEAIVDAALAVALGGRLEEGARNVLIEPWLRATEV
jgi:hypothetical protein